MVIYVVKAAFMPLSAIGGNPANAGVTRLCGVSPCPVPDTATALPNQARYQLRYTRIFNFCHYITARGKIKVFSVCGHLCGQSRFYTVFGNRWKSRKRRCHKALRRFASPYPGYRHGTPKAGALPTALHPVIKLNYPAGRIHPNQARYQLRYTRILNDLMGMDPPEATRRRALHTIPVHYNTPAAKREAYSYPFFFGRGLICTWTGWIN
ncbi:MAG: hypothetical protein V8S83_00135 [Oscillospiraceae bacterium]